MAIKMENNMLGTYENGNYTVTILKDGTKIRETEEEYFIPSFSENTDCKLTDKCSVGCPFCYEGCTSSGKHSEIDFNSPWLNSLHPFTELALNGNDLDHPQLEELLVFLKGKSIITNLTVNEKQLIKGVEQLKEWQKNNMVYGIGVSFSTGDFKTHQEAILATEGLNNVVFHTIAGVTTRGEYEMLSAIHAKVLILGYKELGRGISYKEKNDVDNKIKELKRNLKRLIGKCFVVSFDNLAIEQLGVKELLSESEWNEFYMGDDGQFTFYIDMVKNEYAKNSLSTERFPIGNKTMDEMFNHIRSL
jgi:hypothetical protein